MTKCVKVQFTEGDSARVEPIHNPEIKTESECIAMGLIKDEFGNYVTPPAPDKVFIANVCVAAFPTVKDLEDALNCIWRNEAKSKHIEKARSLLAKHTKITPAPFRAKGGAK